MEIIMDTSLKTVSEMEALLNSESEIKLPVMSKKEKYERLGTILRNVRYNSLDKKEKGIVKKFLKKLTNYSDQQLKRIIAKYRKGKLVWNRWQSNPSKHYTREDIWLLETTESAHLYPCGQTTKAILQREYEVFGNNEYKRLSAISVSHIYNLRKTETYRNQSTKFEKTKNSAVQIGERRKPSPNNQPGFLRVDTVHGGDKEKTKGLYFINMVDEVTQFEFVFCVPAISELYMKQVLALMLQICPYKIINFHSDNGSEYINHIVADLLNKANISQTKSRSRKTNDNALAESKNGSVIRKHFGYIHIPATEENANLVNQFCIKWLNPYLNYHHPCAFPVIEADKRGKEKKNYPQEEYKTPYEKLKTLPNWKATLVAENTPEKLDELASQISDTQFALLLEKNKSIMFSKLKF